MLSAAASSALAGASHRAPVAAPSGWVHIVEQQATTQAGAAPPSAWLSAFAVAAPNDPVAAAVTAIRAGRVRILQGNHLRLEGAVWPAATNSELFVRDCYDPLYSSILGKLQPATSRTNLARRARRFVVAGQPGIGKSVLAWYIMYRLLTEQPSRAIIHIDNTHSCYLIVPGQPVRLCSQAQLESLRNAGELAALNPVFVCDSYVPPTPPFPCVVVASPACLARQQARDSEVFKHYKPWLYIPAPTKQEVLQLHAVAFKHEPEALVKQRLDLWGPSPQQVLAQTTISDQKAAWADACTPTLQDLVLAAKSPFFRSPGGDAPFHVITVRCRGQDAPAGAPESNMHNQAYWERGAVVFASAPMAKLAVQCMVGEQHWSAAFLVDATARVAALGVLRGLTFETAVLAPAVGGSAVEQRKLPRPRPQGHDAVAAPVDAVAAAVEAAETEASRVQIFSRRLVVAAHTALTTVPSADQLLSGLEAASCTK